MRTSPNSRASTCPGCSETDLLLRGDCCLSGKRHFLSYLWVCSQAAGVDRHTDTHCWPTKLLIHFSCCIKQEQDPLQWERNYFAGIKEHVIRANFAVGFEQFSLCQWSLERIDEMIWKCSSILIGK